MQQENQFLRSLFDEAPLPYQSLDSDGRLLMVNRAWEEELRYEKHEVLGRWFGDFVNSDQKELFRERYAQFVDEGRAQGVVWGLIRKDGSVVHVSFNGRIARDDKGRVQRSHCLFFDLAKRSEAEEQLRRSERLRMAFMDHARHGFGMFDAELRLIYINQAGAALFNALPEELIGRHMTNISPGTRHTERYQQFQQVLEHGTVLAIDEYTPPAPYQARRFALLAFRVEGNLGIILRDVTDAKQSEQRILESEAKWRALTEGSPDYVIVLDSEQRVEYVNVPLPGYTTEQMMGDYICHYSGNGQREEIRSTLEAVLASGEAKTFETKHVTPSGDTYFFESRAVPRLVDGIPSGLIVSVRDVSQRLRDQERIEVLLERQTAMAELSVDFGNARTMIDIFRTAHRRISGLMDADNFMITRYEPAASLIHMEYSCADGVEQDATGFRPVPLDNEGRGIQSEVIRTGRPAVLPDYRTVFSEKGTMYATSSDGQDLIKVPQGEAVASLGRSSLVVPMTIRGGVIGVMQVQSNRLDAYQDGDVELLSGLANITAVAIENRSLITKSQSAYEGTIRALATAIELRDPYTSQHQDGVARIATKICHLLNLTNDQRRAVELSAHIHDIGKVVIPAEILSKPTSLTDAQMSIVQAHVEAADEVLADISFPWPIAEIVCQHHERLDGSGYPQRLRGDQIRLEARILAVADIADAMLSHRPYRPAFTLEETSAELRRLANETLDAAVVDACITVLEREAHSKLDSGLESSS